MEFKTQLSKLSTKQIAIAFNCLMLAVLLIFYWPWLAAGRTFYVLDFMGYWQPLLTYMAERFRSGALPLWNPYVCNGVPQFFFPAIVYPLNWLFAICDFSRGMAITFVIQQLVAGTGMFLLIESLGWGLWAAAFGATALCLSGALFSSHIDYVLQGSFAYFPLSLWSLRKLDGNNRSAKSGLSLIGCSLAVYLMITADMPEVFAPALLILFIYSVLSWRHHSKVPAAVHTLLLRTVALASGVLLSAPMILPTLEWLRLSPRASGLPLDVAFANSISWYDLICTVLPQPLGDYHAINKFEALLDSLYVPKSGIPFAKLVISTYVGPVVATLAIWGACDGRWRGRTLLLCFLALAIYISMGWHAPFLANIVEFFHLAIFRNPIKGVPWITFSIVLLAARGVVMLQNRMHTFALAFASVLWAVILAVCSFFLYGGAREHSASALSSLWWQAREAIMQAAIVSSAIGLAACLLFWLRLKSNASKNMILAGTTVAAAACLLSNAWQYNFHPGPPDFYTSKIDLAGKLKQSSQASVQTGMPRLATMVAVALPTREMNFSRPESVVYYKRQMLHPLSGMNEGIATTNYWINGQTSDNRVLWSEATRHYFNGKDVLLGTLCRMSGTNFLLTIANAFANNGSLIALQGPDQRFFKQLYHDAVLNLNLYEVVHPLPRAYFATNVRWGRPHAAIVQFLSHAEESGFDPSKLTILEHNHADEVGPIQETNPSADSKVTLAVDQPERLVLNATTQHAAFVVVTDEFYPGWQAYVDDKPSEIYRANGLFRAIFLPAAGAHRVELVYSPSSLWIGMAIATVTALALAVFAGWAVISAPTKAGDICNS